MTGHERYVVAGRDIGPFVSEWATVLASGGGESRTLWELAVGDDSGYFYGSAFMMANIAARACEPAASADELLLFAVLAVFLMDDFPGVDPEHWEGVDVHLRSAFNYFKEVGDTGAARKLRMEVIERSVQEDPPL
ncbi:hypothetical protein [Paenarthrobacter nicotinovorans]|uniref:hypothetical protein n=1 Tax=Paenarthrobacter nicotinovorans TaxID=29320 RepID=UPI003A8079ED